MKKDEAAGPLSFACSALRARCHLLRTVRPKYVPRPQVARGLPIPGGLAGPEGHRPCARPNGLEPLGHLRDLLCLLPTWPEERLIELAPVSWRATRGHEATQHALAANVFRQVSLGRLDALPARAPASV